MRLRIACWTSPIQLGRAGLGNRALDAGEEGGKLVSAGSARDRRLMPKPLRASALTQPHDALFKWIFSQREHAAGLLKATLPPALVEAVDWRTLRLEKGSFVDRALRHRH